MEDQAWGRLAERYGATGEPGAWKAVQEDYYWDRLDVAYEAASSMGTGSYGLGLTLYRMIEAEHITRNHAQVDELTDWLELEWIPNDVSLSLSEVKEILLDAADEVCRRFEWTHGPKTRVTILARSANAPWAPGRHGFCVDKNPYDKICLPGNLTDHPQELHEAMRHEYAHVMTLNRSDAQVPIWLDEAIAMQASSGLHPQAGQMFAAGNWPWLSEHDLIKAFRSDRESEHGQNLVWRAYQQSAAIGAFLANEKGEKFLGSLMDAFTNNSMLSDLVMRMKGQEPVDEALGEIYGFGVKKLWEECRVKIR